AVLHERHSPQLRGRGRDRFGKLISMKPEKTITAVLLAVMIAARMAAAAPMEKAAFAAGCFWHTEAAFRKIDGVISVTSGYTGGTKPNPTYEEVCSDKTGHAEAVLVEFDPAKVSYERLLDVFWSEHDPTTPNRQGWDVGSQYRSAIFYYSPAQQ